VVIRMITDVRAVAKQKEEKSAALDTPPAQRLLPHAGSLSLRGHGRAAAAEKWLNRFSPRGKLKR
jgi:hypothetical protein